MARVRLQSVVRENWRSVIGLQVREDQKSFVASNLYSLAQAAYQPEFKPMAIYANEQLVGFSLYGCETPETAWIVRLMIDQAHQRNGYGRAALNFILDDSGPRPACTEFALASNRKITWLPPSTAPSASATPARSRTSLPAGTQVPEGAAARSARAQRLAKPSSRKLLGNSNLN
jgi:GNAT superfamily N-acetyltransferase